MAAVILSVVLLAALAVAASRGPRAAFAWVYLPAMILIPVEVSANLPVFPNLTGRRAAVIGLLIGAALGGRGSLLVPSWRPFDWLPVVLVFGHSLSFMAHTEALGFVHSIAVDCLDWLLPYFLARSLWTNYRDVRDGLKPMVAACVVLSVISLYEARMATRVGREFWGALTGLWVPPHFEMWRWGYLRAFGTFTHPITLGVFLAAAAPLAILWGQLDPRYRLHSRIAALACAVGCATSLSRGPMLALAAAAMLGVVLSKRRKLLYVAVVPALALLLPVALDAMSEAIAFTQSELSSEGNTDSGHYRLALLLIYLDDIGRVGWFGNREIVGDEFEAAWSIDNGYLFLFMNGGWITGGLFLAMTVTALVLGGLAVQRASGTVRRVRASAFASLLGFLFGMGDVWFAPDYSPLFFLCTGLVINQTRSAWFGARARARPTPIGPPPRAPAAEWLRADAVAVSRH